MKISFRLIVAAFIAAVYSVPVFAQAPLRVEIEAKKSSDDYHIVPVGKNGILLFYESSERAKDGGRNWVFTMYSTDFKEVWNKEYPVKGNLDFVDFVSKNDRDIYLLLGHPSGVGTQGITRGNYEIINVNTESGVISNINGMVPMSSIIDHFDVVNGYGYLTGISVPSKGTTFFSSCLWILPVPCISYMIFAPMIFVAHPQIFQVDLSSGTMSIVSKKLKGMGFVVGTGSSEADKSENIIIRNEPNKHTNQVICYSYSGGGGLSNTIEIKGQPDKVINRANLLKLNPKESILIGTYSNAAVKTAYFRNLGPNRITNGYNAISNGLFFTKTEDDQTVFTKYYDFSKFESFYKYLQQKYGSFRADKRAKNTHQLNYLLLVHDIIQQNNQYIMVAEAYYPEYETHYEQYYVAGTGTTPGHWETRRVDVFVGFRYTHAIVAGFDKEGTKLWDNTFEIENILTFDLKERVKILPQGNTTVLAYSFNGNIDTKVIQGNDVVQGKFSTPIETNYKGDKVMYDYAGDMSYWYDNYFVTYGYARIKNTDKPQDKGGKQDRKRTVFYFNKIAFQ
jgi:hypothetical protein